MLFPKKPKALNITDCPSPNFDSRQPGMAVDTVVLHSTVLSSAKATCAHFANPKSRVSAHYTISKRGGIYRHVDEADRAWHAGESLTPDGRAKANDFSIGIELVNLNDGEDPYPEAQIAALNTLLKAIANRHPIAHLLTHAEIAQPPGRKSDPKNFDMGRLNPLSSARNRQM